jgi:branched-chain amino acid transport system permease protein
VPLQPNMMDTILVYALAAAVLGGLDSPLGAVVAAWLIGVVETVAGANIDVIGSDLRIAVPLVLLALILLVRPQDRLAAGRARRRRHPQPCSARC